jgi:hypothetical protein
VPAIVQPLHRESKKVQRKSYYHGYTIERTTGPNGGLYTIWDGPQRRIDKGEGFNSLIEAQVFINRLESSPAYVENDYRTALKVAQAMIDMYVNAKPEHEAYFSSRAANRFAEAIAEEIARIRSLRTGEDLD